MPAVVAGKIVADDPDFRLLMRRPVVGGGRLAIERKPSGRDDIDEIVGDRPALRIEQKIALEECPPEHDQITQEKRKPDQPDCSRRGNGRGDAGQLLGDVHAAAKAKTLAREA